ncbi:MAG: hypothetical protein ACM3UV_07790 [Nocardioidaceae bacterium]
MTTHLGEGGEGVAVAIYGLDLFIASLTLSAFIGYAASKPDLVADEIADNELTATLRQRRGLLSAQGVATLVAFLLPNVAVLLYLLSGVAFIVAPLFLARHSRRGGTPATPATTGLAAKETHAHRT